MSEEFDLEKWLCDVTKQEDLEAAKQQVLMALNVLKIYPSVGVVSILVGPGGALSVCHTANLGDPEGMENVELALMDVSREILSTRRRMKEQPQAVFAAE